MVPEILRALSPSRHKTTFATSSIFGEPVQRARLRDLLSPLVAKALRHLGR